MSFGVVASLLLASFIGSTQAFEFSLLQSNDNNGTVTDAEVTIIIPVTSCQDFDATSALIALKGQFPTATIDTAICTSGSQVRNLQQSTGARIEYVLSNLTPTQAALLKQQIAQGFYASVGIPSTAIVIVTAADGSPIALPPVAPLAPLSPVAPFPFSVPPAPISTRGVTVTSGVCRVQTCPTTCNSAPVTFTNPSTTAIVGCDCGVCSVTQKEKRQLAQTASIYYLFTTAACQGITDDDECAAAVANDIGCYVLDDDNGFSLAAQDDLVNGGWSYYVNGNGPVTFGRNLSCGSSSSSKKGLLGLLGLLGLIPLILCCCLLLLCFMRKKKAGPDVNFATFEPVGPPAIGESFVPPMAGSFVPPMTHHHQMPLSSVMMPTGGDVCVAPSAFY